MTEKDDFWDKEPHKTYKFEHPKMMKYVKDIFDADWGFQWCLNYASCSFPIEACVYEDNYRMNFRITLNKDSRLYDGKNSDIVNLDWRNGWTGVLELVRDSDYRSFPVSSVKVGKPLKECIEELVKYGKSTLVTCLQERLKT